MVSGPYIRKHLQAGSDGDRPDEKHARPRFLVGMRLAPSDRLVLAHKLGRVGQVRVLVGNIGVAVVPNNMLMVPVGGRVRFGGLKM